MKPFILYLTCFWLSPAWSADMIGTAVTTDDVCAVRPELCGGKPVKKRNKKKSDDLDFGDFGEVETPAKAPKPAVKTAAARDALEKEFDALNEPPKAEKKKKKKLKRHTWEHDGEILVDEIAELDIEREPAVVKKSKPADPTPKMRRHKISFDSYFSANSSHGALSSRLSGRQDAFQQADRPAILVGPTAVSVPLDSPVAPSGADGASAAAAVAAPVSPAGQSVRENQ